MKRRFLTGKGVQWKNCTDEEVISKYLETGSPVYFSVLFDRYSHLVFGTCMKYLNNEEESRDMTMEIFEKTLINLPRQEINSFNKWIYSVTRNICISRLRSKNKEHLNSEEWEKIKKRDGSFMENEGEQRLCIENNQNGEDNLRQAVKQLDENQRQCIELFFLEGHSYKVIEQLTGFNQNQVKSYLQNGKRRLKKILSQM